MNQSDFIVKSILIGDAGVGKTTLAKKLTDLSIKHDEISTIGVDFFMVNTKIDNKTFKLHIWDTAGNERFIHLVKSYFKNNAICYILFDVCNYNSFTSVQKWIDIYYKNTFNPSSIIVIVGTKTDNTERRKVPYQEGLRLANNNNAMYFEISSKTSVGLNMIIKEPLKRLYGLYQNKLVISSDISGFRCVKDDKNYFNVNDKPTKKCCTIQ